MTEPARKWKRISGELDAIGRHRHPCAMKSMMFGLWACAGIASSGAARAQAPLPPLPSLPQAHAPEKKATAPGEVVASAVAAVEELGKQVVLGRYQMAVDRMYPLWKERAAKRAGGMEALERQLSEVGAEMVRQGISMISSQPQGQPRVFEVGPGKKNEVIDGEEVETLIYTKWLVMVPTVTRFRILREGDPKPLILENLSYQVAISDKGANDWTFIDGSGLSVPELRRLFINLPQDLQLPPLEKREVR